MGRKDPSIRWCVVCVCAPRADAMCDEGRARLQPAPPRPGRPLYSPRKQESLFLASYGSGEALRVASAGREGHA